LDCETSNVGLIVLDVYYKNVVLILVQYSLCKIVD